MAGTLDLHAIYALENGLRSYVTDPVAFASLFHGLEPAVVEEWRALLVNRMPAFRADASGAPPEKPTPWVIVALADERVDERALADFAGRSDEGGEILEFYVTQTIRVSIFAWHPEIAVAVHVLLRAVSLLAEHAFFDAGYDGFSYEGADPLSPQEEMLTVELGVCLRVLRFQAKSKVQAVRPAEMPDTFSWFVQLDGVAISPAWGVVDGELLDGTPIPAPGAGETGEE